MSRLAASLVFALVAACGLAEVTAQTAAPVAPSARTAPKTNPDPARFDREIAAFEAWDRQNSAPEDAVLFVGSSSIRMWQTAEAFPEFSVINRGFGGSHASDVVHFTPRIVLKYKPRLIVYYAGDNDIADGKTPEQVADDFRKFVELVQEKLPSTEIIYLPIKPSLARWKLWPKMQEANTLVKQFIESNAGLQFVDTATPMLGSDGQPRPDIFLSDGLHMNERGYQIWNEILAERLAAH
ncbi:MAG: SGNH/GDSL hydrolase family protein [Pirellulales bacterium]